MKRKLQALGKTVWVWYVSHLNARPLLTQASTTGIICGLGDVIAQEVIEKRRIRDHRWKRTAKMTLIGFCFTGPVLCKWFQLLDKIVGPSQTSAAVIKKVLFDQGLFAPVLYICLLPLFGLSQGMNGAQIRDKVKKEYFNMLTSSYKLWPAVQVINFYVIPLKFRVNYANIVSLSWNTYVARLANR